MENYDCNQSAERVLMDASRKKNQNRNRLLFIVITTATMHRKHWERKVCRKIIR